MRFGKRDYRITGGRSWNCSSRNRLVNKQQAKQSRAQLSSFGGVTVDTPEFREARQELKLETHGGMALDK